MRRRSRARPRPGYRHVSWCRRSCRRCPAPRQSRPAPPRIMWALAWRMIVGPSATVTNRFSQPVRENRWRTPRRDLPVATPADSRIERHGAPPPPPPGKNGFCARSVGAQFVEPGPCRFSRTLSPARRRRRAAQPRATITRPTANQARCGGRAASTRAQKCAPAAIHDHVLAVDQRAVEIENQGDASLRSFFRRVDDRVVLLQHPNPNMSHVFVPCAPAAASVTSITPPAGRGSTRRRARAGGMRPAVGRRSCMASTPAMVFVPAFRIAAVGWPIASAWSATGACGRYWRLHRQPARISARACRRWRNRVSEMLRVVLAMFGDAHLFRIGLR